MLEGRIVTLLVTNIIICMPAMYVTVVAKMLLIQKMKLMQFKHFIKIEMY